MEDVARRANVSVATVSRVLSKPHLVNTRTRELVLKTVQELDYHLNPLARNLRTLQTRRFAVVVSHLTDSLTARVVEELDCIAARHDYSLQIYFLRADSKRLERLMQGGYVDGIFWLATPSDDLADSTTALLILNASHPHLPCLGFDYAQMTYQATSYLLEAGYIQIMLLYGETAYPARLTGYSQALTDYRRPIVHTYETLEQLFANLQTPAAILAPNDYAAALIYGKCQKQCLSIPQDVAVIGCGDSPYAQYLYPPLTTFAMPVEQLACAAFDLLLDMHTTGNHMYPELLFAPEMVIRESVGSHL
jgi:LacI family repressor for deo operon, udp, cdd, tsx, nupC, and nupG